MAEDQGTFDLWITDRIAFTIAGGNTGDFDTEVTDRILWWEYTEEAAGEERMPRHPAQYNELFIY